MTVAVFPHLRGSTLTRSGTGRIPFPFTKRIFLEFRALREKHEFLTICQTPELACEITLQPVGRYTGLLDAAIIFSDIIVVPKSNGMTVDMLPTKGSHFPNPPQTPEDIGKLPKVIHTDKELKCVYDAITLTRSRLERKVPLVGFCGAPWTLFAYMIEGGSKALRVAKT